MLDFIISAVSCVDAIWYTVIEKYRNNVLSIYDRNISMSSKLLGISQRNRWLYGHQCWLRKVKWINLKNKDRCLYNRRAEWPDQVSYVLDLASAFKLCFAVAFHCYFLSSVFIFYDRLVNLSLRNMKNNGVNSHGGAENYHFIPGTQVNLIWLESIEDVYKERWLRIVIYNNDLTDMS